MLFSNLIDNAVRYTVPGMRVPIAALPDRRSRAQKTLLASKIQSAVAAGERSCPVVGRGANLGAVRDGGRAPSEAYRAPTSDETSFSRAMMRAH
jgi:hypothetical protein